MPKKDNLSQQVRDWLIADRKERSGTPIVNNGGSLPLQQKILDFVMLLTLEQRKLLLTYLRLKFELITRSDVHQDNRNRDAARRAFTLSLGKEGSLTNSSTFRPLEAEVNAIIINNTPDNQKLDAVVFFYSFGMTGNAHAHKVDRLILENVVPSIAEYKPKAKTKYRQFVDQESSTINKSQFVAQESLFINKRQFNFQTARAAIEAFFKQLFTRLPKNEPQSNHLKQASISEKQQGLDIITESDNDGDFSHSHAPTIPSIVITPAKSNDSVDANDGLDSCDDDAQQQLELEKQQAALEREKGQARLRQIEAEAKQQLLLAQEREAQIEKQRLENERLEREKLEQEKSDHEFAKILQQEEQELRKQQDSIEEKDALLAQELSTQLNEEQELEQAPLDTDAILAFQEQIKHIIQILASHSAEQSLHLLGQYFELRCEDSAPIIETDFKTTHRKLSLLLVHNGETMKVDFNDSVFINTKAQTQTRDIDAKIENINDMAADSHWLSSAFGNDFHYQQTSDIIPNLTDHQSLLFYQTPQVNSCGLEAGKAYAEEYNKGLIY